MTEFNYSERWPLHPQFQHIRVLNSPLGNSIESAVWTYNDPPKKKKKKNLVASALIIIGQQVLSYY